MIDAEPPPSSALGRKGYGNLRSAGDGRLPIMNPDGEEPIEIGDRVVLRSGFLQPRQRFLP
jgi:hypothetical protein